MRRDKASEFGISLVMLIFGAALLLWPEGALSVVVTGLSIVVTCFGIVLLVSYLFRKALRPVSQPKLIAGILLVLGGIFLVPRLGIVLSIVPFILGILIVVSGISKLLHAFEYKKMGYSSWWITLVIALLAIVVGIVVGLNPFKTIRLALRVIGIALILDNFANVFDTLYLRYRLKKDGYVVVDSDDDIIDIIQKDDL